MRPWQRLARTEILEQRRQPAMLFVLVLNYLVILGVFVAGFFYVNAAIADPATREALTEQLTANGVELDALLRVAVSTFGSLLFTNLPLYVAVFSANSVLHD